MRKNHPNQSISVELVTANGTAVTSGTTNIYITKDGGDQASGAGVVEHEGNGQWTYHFTQEETNADSVAILFENSSAVLVNRQIYTVP